MIWIVLGIVFALIFGAVVASQFSQIAEMKGHDGSKYFWFTFLFGICGMLMVIALPNNKTAENNDVVRREHFIVRNEPQNRPTTYTETSNIKDVNKTNPPVSAEISNGEKVCPKCGQSQRVDRRVCWSCGQQFDN